MDNKSVDCYNRYVIVRPMSRMDSTKKPALKDWHKADIKAALEKAGWTLRKLAKHHGYSTISLFRDALSARTSPKGERLLAEAIGADPALIWPSRYAGKRNRSPSKYHHRRAA